jgi:hypothetical protein
MPASCPAGPTAGDRTGSPQPGHRSRAAGGGTVAPMTTVIVLLGFFALLSVADLLPSAVR